MRLQKALSVEESTISSMHLLKQQVLALSSQLKEREALIHSQKKKVKSLILCKVRTEVTVLPNNIPPSFYV